MLNVFVGVIFCIVVAAAIAILTLVAIYFLAYPIYFFLGYHIVDRIFDSSLAYIKKNGCGLKDDENANAFAIDLKKRLAWITGVDMFATGVTAILTGLVLTVAINSGVAILYLACFGLVLGMIVGSIYFYECMAEQERAVKKVVGRLESVKPEKKSAIFVDSNGFRYEFSFKGNDELFSDLVLDKDYYVADYVWCLKIANSNDAEWEDEDDAEN